MAKIKDWTFLVDTELGKIETIKVTATTREAAEAKALQVVKAKYDDEYRSSEAAARLSRARMMTVQRRALEKCRRT